jgi:pSer/pThr/pTyr-binding forkhead associated (FHA) protein
MILCPNCQHHEITGALFCSECGAQLVYADGYSTHAIHREGVSSTLPPAKRPVTATLRSTATDSLISLFLLDTGKVLPLAGRSDFSIGRVIEGQPILPDVDLSPYEAYSQGVSRLHAVLKIINQQVFIVDLGSSNGTRVNGQKLVPNIEYPLNHGDLLLLGRLKIQILLRQ